MPRNLGNNELIIKLYFSSSVLLCYVTQILSYSSDYYFTRLFWKYIKTLVDREASCKMASLQWSWIFSGIPVVKLKTQTSNYHQNKERDGVVLLTHPVPLKITCGSQKTTLLIVTNHFNFNSIIKKTRISLPKPIFPFFTRVANGTLPATFRLTHNKGEGKEKRGRNKPWHLVAIPENDSSRFGNPTLLKLRRTEK